MASSGWFIFMFILARGEAMMLFGGNSSGNRVATYLCIYFEDPHSDFPNGIHRGSEIRNPGENSFGGFICIIEGTRLLLLVFLHRRLPNWLQEAKLFKQLSRSQAGLFVFLYCGGHLGHWIPATDFEFICFLDLHQDLKLIYSSVLK